MPRPRKTPDNTDLMPWAEIARRLRMPVAEVRAMYDRALAKLRAACEAEGLDAETVRLYLRDRDREDVTHERLMQYINLYFPEYTPVSHESKHD